MEFYLQSVICLYGVQRDNFTFAICGCKAGKLSALRNEFDHRPAFKLKLSSFHPNVFIDNSRKYGQSNTTLFRFFYLVIGDMFRPGLGHHQAFSKNTVHLTVIS